MDEDLLGRIAAALDRLAPVPAPVKAEPLDHPAYVWRDGQLEAARSFRPLPLALLTSVDQQKRAFLENARRLAAGLPAHDVLLWGARGSGKSALVKASVGALQADGAAIALIEVAPDRLASLPALFDRIEGLSRAFLLFIDDLGFSTLDGEARHLRSLLEGGAEARPDNARLAVTSNRRHLVPRDHAAEAQAVSARDAADDTLALADRFGLSLGFHVCDQDAYLLMVEHYATAFELPFDRGDALAWSVGRGARSGRVAWQYIIEVAGREGRPIS